MKNWGTLLIALLFVFAGCSDKCYYNIVKLKEASTDGTTGFYIKEVGGESITQFNATFPFYPASSIKTLHLAQAFLLIEDSQLALNDNLTVYRASNESCQDDHNGHTATSVTVREAIREMMFESNNQTPNALQEQFGGGNAQSGLDILSQLMDNIGMTDASDFKHKFACGGAENEDPNTLTLVDLGKLYEAMATDLFADSTTKDAAFGAMLGGHATLEAIADEEAPKHNIAADKLATFKAGIQAAHKAGNVTPNGVFYRAVGGWVSLPTGDGGTKEYVYGYFAHEASALAADFDIWELRAELLRIVVCRHLLTFKDN